MRRQDKKGQAAMEFLMTYGWAILAAIIAIGVLAYFGVFSPGRFVQDSVFISAPLGAPSAVVNATGIFVEVQNGAGDTITLNNFTVTTTSPSPTILCYNDSGVVINAGASGIVRIIAAAGCDGALPGQGERMRGNILVRYNSGSAAFDGSATGTITATVQ